MNLTELTQELGYTPEVTTLTEDEQQFLNESETVKAPEISPLSDRFYVLGTTDTVCTCDACGKQNLKKTVVLDSYDGAGNPNNEPMYLGTTCAHYALLQNNQKGLANKVTEKSYLKSLLEVTFFKARGQQFKADFSRSGDFVWITNLRTGATLMDSFVFSTAFYEQDGVPNNVREVIKAWLAS